jgi:hypothetical protein
MQVTKYINIIVQELINRAEQHDLLKLEDPEKELFDEFTPKLSELTYGSPEYQKCLEGLKPALDHHYARSRHHPEHFNKEGISAMDLVDLVEMLCDWKAASLRQNGGNILTSIEGNAARFGYGEELSKIFTNTVHRLFEE